MSMQTGPNAGSLAAGTVPAPPKSSPARETDDDLFDEMADEEDYSAKRPGRRFSWRIPIILAVLALIGFGIYKGLGAARKGAALQTQYKIATVSRGQVKKTVTASGTLKPWSTVDIKSKAGGRVDQLLVNEGDTVTAGQIIA
ncbi:MAG: hypothetical protein V4671_28965, partial [Armatimonadota bacterium]